MAHPKAGRPGQAPSVKYFAAVLTAAGFDRWEELLDRFGPVLGDVDYRGHPVAFDMTDYYRSEMGPGIERTIISFSRHGDPSGLPRIKLATAAMEEAFEISGGRRVNIDPGYVDFYKAVLASFKEGPQKIFLGQGVYADPVLRYVGGKWDVFPWTFPDLRKGLYMDDFDAIRRIYRLTMRARSS